MAAQGGGFCDAKNAGDSVFLMGLASSLNHWITPEKHGWICEFVNLSFGFVLSTKRTYELSQNIISILAPHIQCKHVPPIPYDYVQYITVLL